MESRTFPEYFRYVGVAIGDRGCGLSIGDHIPLAS